MREMKRVLGIDRQAGIGIGRPQGFGYRPLARVFGTIRPEILKGAVMRADHSVHPLVAIDRHRGSAVIVDPFSQRDRLLQELPVTAGRFKGSAKIDRWLLAVAFGREQALDFTEELCMVDRLGDKSVHTGLQALLPVFLHGVCGHGDDGDVPAQVRLRPPDDAGCL